MASWYLQSSTKCIGLTRLLWSGILFSVRVKEAASHSIACLTWQHNDNTLRLICKLNNVKSSVSIIDPNDNHRAYCNINANRLKCFSTFTNEYAEYKENLRQVALTITPVKSQLEGKWICQQGNHSYTTKVDMARGIMSSTNVSLQGQMHEGNSQHWTQLTCSSCRTPYKNIAEFQMNGRTVAQIRFDRKTKTCILGNETCTGTKCRCSLNGNDFFLRMDAVNESSYSCVMLFVDNEKGGVYQQRSTLLFDGKELHRRDRETEILERAAAITARTTTGTSSTVTQQEDASNILADYWGVWIACVILILVAIIVLVFANIGKKSKKKEEGHFKSTNTEETSPMIIKGVSKPSHGCELINVTVHGSGAQEIESVPLFYIPMEVHLYQKRWLLFGICCLKVYHSFRRDIERLFSTKFNILKMNYNVEEQTYERHKQTKVPNTDWQLNYKVINDNEKNFGNNIGKYDFRIKSATELSKMVIPEEYTNYSAFDDTMSFDTILHLFNVFSLYKNPGDPKDTFRSMAKEIFQSTWSRWCVPRTTDWDEQHLKKSTSLLVAMSSHYLQSNQEPMSENEIEIITEKGMTLLDGSFDLNDNKIMERIVNYMTELVHFLDMSHSETSSNEIPDIKHTISEWRCKLKRCLDESYSNNEKFIYNCKLCRDKNKNRKADCWCFECDVLYCQKCKDLHLSMASLTDHNVIDADLYSELLPVTRKCQKHVMNDVEYLCTKHDELCCQTCILASNEHRKCDGVHQISRIKTKSLEKLNLYKKQLEEQLCVLQSLCALNASVFSIDSNERFCEEIEQLVKRYCLANNEKFENYLHALKTYYNEVKDKIALEFKAIDLEATLKEMLTELDQEKRQFEIAMKTNSDRLLFLFVHTSALKLNVTETRISTLAHHFSDKTESKNTTNVQKLCLQSIEWLLKSYKKPDLFHQE